MNKNINIFITGGNGFIGKSLLDYFVKYDNINVFVISRGSNVKNGFFYLSDYHDTDWLIREISHLENIIVIHTASNIPQKANEYFDKSIFLSNVQIDDFIVKVFSKCYSPKFIYTSSIAVLGYGYIDLKDVSEESPLSINDYYAESKAYGETIVSENFKNYVIMRLSSPYGIHNRRETVMTQMINSVLNNENIFIYGMGERTQDFIYIDDVCKTIERLIFNNPNSGIYNIASGHPCKMHELAETVISVFNAKSNFKCIEKTEGFSVTINNEKIRDITKLDYLNIFQGLNCLKEKINLKKQRENNIN